MRYREFPEFIVSDSQYFFDEWVGSRSWSLFEYRHHRQRIMINDNSLHSVIHGTKSSNVTKCSRKPISRWWFSRFLSHWVQAAAQSPNWLFRKITVEHSDGPRCHQNESIVMSNTILYYGNESKFVVWRHGSGQRWVVLLRADSEHPAVCTPPTWGRKIRNDVSRK